jgi:hypothetical protein
MEKDTVTNMAKLNRSVRYLVLNRTNEAVVPRDENLPGFAAADLKASGDIRKKYSPSFMNEGAAKAFGAALAAKYPGQTFYLATITAGCLVEPATGPWVPTGAGIADETLAEDVDSEDLDGSDEI